MKIGLGTAQFGLDYGISNPGGRVATPEARRILALAERSGVRTIDTAAAYGDAEARLGRYLAADHPFSLVTKLPRLPDGVTGAGVSDWVREAVARSLRRLRTELIHGLLVHSVADLLGPLGEPLWLALLEARRDGWVDRIGASVYSGEEIDRLMERYPLELVQVPVSVLDQRLVRSGHLARLGAASVEVHARSIFLQGLLLMDPDELADPYFDPARATIRAFRAAARAVGHTPLEAAVAYAVSVPDVSVAVVGVTGEGQLAEVLAAATPSLPLDWFAPFAAEDVNVLDPSRWPR